MASIFYFGPMRTGTISLVFAESMVTDSELSLQGLTTATMAGGMALRESIRRWGCSCVWIMVVMINAPMN